MNLNKTNIISASILAADLACLGQEVKKVLAAGADWIHIDVMDNHFVPNLTFGAAFCRALRKYGVVAPFDVHLMTSTVDQLIIECATAGANLITIHPESTNNLSESLQLIRKVGCQAGLALSPNTSIAIIEKVYKLIDLILIMSVNPGFAGQQFITNSYSKIITIKALCDKLNYTLPLAIDGGVDHSNINMLAKHGIEIFVVGSSIFHSVDYVNTISNLRQLLPFVN